MGKKTNTKDEGKISLSLKDLERLGVIKKRLKRKRKANRKLNKVLDAVIGGVKSDSSHLQKGYTNQFQNTSNLTTEGHRLQNQLLNEAHDKHRYEVGKQRDELEYHRNENEAFKNHAREAINFLFSNNNRIENDPIIEEADTPVITRFNSIPNRTQFYQYDDNDNIDVPRTDGSEYHFKGEPISQESVAHQSLDALKQINSSLNSINAVGGGETPKTPKSFFSMGGIFGSKQDDTPRIRPESGLSLKNPSLSAEVKMDKAYKEDDDFQTTNPLPKPKLKRQTSQERAEQFSNLQAEYIDRGVPSPIVYQAENMRDLKAIGNGYLKEKQLKNNEVEEYRRLGGNNEYVLGNLENLTSANMKKINAKLRKGKK